MKELSKDLLTEKGNLKASVQKGFREQAIASLTDDGYVVMPNGKLSKVVGTIGDNVVSINIELSIGLNTNFDKKDSKRKAKTTESVVVPDLFEN